MPILPSIGIMGGMRAGKDTMARRLVDSHGYRRLSFADPVRRAIGALNPVIRVDEYGRHIGYQDIIDTLGYEAAKDAYPEVRRLLQVYGTHLRDHIDRNIWLNELLRRAYHEVPENVPIVVPDVRFPNEARALWNAGFLIVRVKRPGFVPLNARHVSETAHETIIADVTVMNVGDLADLHAGTDALATEPMYSRERFLIHPAHLPTARPRS